MTGAETAMATEMVIVTARRMMVAPKLTMAL
jgi:hypothetical protein